MEYRTANEIEATLGQRLRALRIAENLDQRTVAERAGVSVNAVKYLESGRGTVRSLVAVLRVLGRGNWVDAIAPVPTINPLAVTDSGTVRQRVRTGSRPRR
jgi:transcriptional regulator with XRE-family HTH domain